MALDDKLRTEEHAPGSLESRVNEQKPWEKKFSLGRLALDAMLLGAGYLGVYGIGTLLGSGIGVLKATLYHALGLIGGRFIENWRLKKKGTYSDYRKEVGISLMGGWTAYAMYMIPDLLINNATLAGKVLKTLVFNPLFVAPWILGYRTTAYIRDNIGINNFVKGLFNFKWLKYLKEAYQKDIKPNYIQTVKDSFINLAPIHFFSMNYVQNVPTRVLIGSANDILYRLIAGGTQKQSIWERIYHGAAYPFKKIAEKVKPAYSLQPAYSAYKH